MSCAERLPWPTAGRWTPLHLATAILFRQNLDEPLELCALDERMRALAATLGFAVTPRA